MTQTSSKRKHADFQSRYRRSSNFRSVAKNEKFQLNDSGELELSRKKESKETSPE